MPIYPSLTEPDIRIIARDCEPVVAIVSSDAQLAKVRAIRPQLPSLRAVIVMEVATGLEPAARESTWPDALRQGREAAAQTQQIRETRLAQLMPEQAATLIYTSGTTGDPKGVMLSHRNFLSNADAGLRALTVQPSDTHLSFLPLSHVFERMAGWYLMMMAGASVAYAENMDTISENMLEVRPTVMLGVPRFFEKLHARVREGLDHLPDSKRHVAQWALRIGRKTSPYRRCGQPIPWSLRPWAWLAERLVFHQLKQRLGGRLRFFVSGSAALQPAIAEFFFDAGIPILEGYGLTETSPVIAVNRLSAIKFGTVGQPLDGVDVRIAEDGEILTRGPHVMQGYYRKPEDTRATIVDGWLHTGDIGRLDDQGFLSITDRKKDLIKTSGGKFVAPQKLERLFATDPYIAQAFVYGERERYCVALIVPNFARLSELAPQQHWSCRTPHDLASSPEVQTFLWQRLQQLQCTLPSFEQIKSIALLDEEFSQSSGELTPTLKAKRAVIAQRHHALLTQLYQQPPPHGG